MRVTLVVPPMLAEDDDNLERIEYLGIGYIAAVARQNGYPVDILDCRYQEIDHAQAVQAINASNPDVIGITAPFVLGLTSTVKLSKALRAAGYKGPIVLGGHPATFTADTLLARFPSIDAVIRGEGEFTFVELLRHLEEGSAWDDIPGLAYRENGHVTITRPRPLLSNLDDIPFPARDNIASGGVPSAVMWFRDQGMLPSTVLLSSRGCPFYCSFCSVQAFYGLSPGSRWRYRSAQNVVAEMVELAEKWGVRAFRFSDDNFFGSCRKGKVRAQELAQLLIQRDTGLRFMIECRVSDVEPRLFSLLKQAGLSRANVGVESGVSRALQSFNKKISVEQNKRALSILKELGIGYHPNFILIDAETKLEELRENWAFFKETRIYRIAEAFHVIFGNRLGLFAGTTLLDQYRAQGRVKPWKFPDLDEEDQRLTTEIGAIWDYDLDPHVIWFLKLNSAAIAELIQRDRNLSRLQGRLRSYLKNAAAPGNGLQPSQLLPTIERWRANAGVLAFQLFGEALNRAEKENIQTTATEPILAGFMAEIDRYDTLHFGKTVPELIAMAEMPSAVPLPAD